MNILIDKFPDTVCVNGKDYRGRDRFPGMDTIHEVGGRRGRSVAN